VATILLLILSSQEASSEISNIMNAEQLLKLCNQSDPKTPSGDSNGGICFGYITGVINTYEMLQRVCVPKPIPDGQISLTVIAFLSAHAEMAKWLAPLAILMAAEGVYPCQKDQKKG
jgi:hypothetical protein